MTAKLFRLMPFVLFAFAHVGFTENSSSHQTQNSISSNSFHSFVQANFLYWHVSEDFLDLFLGGPQFLSFTEHPQPFHFHTKYHPGLQVAIGFSKPHQKWAFLLDATNLHFHNSTLFANHDPNFFIPSCEWFEPLFSAHLAPESTLKARWSFLFQDFGLNLLATFFSNNYWSLKPFLGMKLLFIDQRYDLFLHAVSTTDFSTSEAHSSAESFSWALGPRMGGDFDCSLGKGLHLLGTGAFALFYQEFSENHYNTGTTELPITIANKASFHKLCPAVDAKLGLGYQHSLSENICISLSAFYEFHYLAMQQQMHTLLTKASTYSPAASYGGDLFMHGLTTGIELRW